MNHRLYNATYHHDINTLAKRSAEQVVPLVDDLLQPRSVVDVGCGLGTWLQCFQERGIDDVVGVDYRSIKASTLLFRADRFIAADLSQSLCLNRTFDLVVSLEVAEHLPEHCAPTFIDELTQLGPAVLFSAAIPFQGGHLHCNEQWQAYWAELFAQRDYQAIDCIRQALWHHDDVAYWYAQNCLLYVRRDYLEHHPRLKQEQQRAQNAPLSVVHPKMLTTLTVWHLANLLRQIVRRRLQTMTPYMLTQSRTSCEKLTWPSNLRQEGLVEQSAVVSRSPQTPLTHAEAETCFEPSLVTEVELSQSLPDILMQQSQTGRPYQRARVLVRLYGQPLGCIELDLGIEGLRSTALADQIWQECRTAIEHQLQLEGLPPVESLGSGGLNITGQPLSMSERKRILAEGPHISVVVCTRDRTDSLAECLTGLLKQSYPGYEIIVIDNAPATDATAVLLRERYAALAHVRYIREDRPGLQWARNCGLAHAKGEIVAYTDDDVIPDSEWLMGLARAFVLFPEVVCVTGLVAPRELETPAQAWFEQYGGLGLGYKRRFFNLAEHRPNNPFFPYTGLCAVGANLAVKVDVCRAIGGFDPALDVGTPALGGGDLELCFRLVTHGYTLAYEPSALVWHTHRRMYNQLRRQIFAYGAGFTAYLTTCLLDDPRRIARFAALVPYGTYLMLHSRSVHNSKKTSDYPCELSWLERLGLLYGPLAYARSKLSTARLRNSAMAQQG